MKKNIKDYIDSRLIAEVLPVIAFDALFFALVDIYTPSRWIGWLCLHVGYGLMILVGRKVVSGDSGMVYGYPKIAVASALFVMTILAFTWIFLVNPESAKWPAILEVIILTGSGVMLCVLQSTENASRTLEAETKKNLVFVRYASEMLLQAKGNVSDIPCRKALDAAYDAVRNGNVASVPAAADIEQEIQGIVDEIVEKSSDPSNLEKITEMSRSIVQKMKKRETLIKISR